MLYDRDGQTLQRTLRDDRAWPTERKQILRKGRAVAWSYELWQKGIRTASGLRKQRVYACIQSFREVRRSETSQIRTKKRQIRGRFTDVLPKTQLA